MKKKIKLGLLKETKTPPDKRVTATPQQCLEIMKQFPNVDVFVQSSNIRCFKDDEYTQFNIPVVKDMDDCDILMGVKEVDINTLIAGKTYIFFSHTTKKQPYNRNLLKEIVKSNIALMDHEHFTDKNHIRLVAFGRWAGIVGAFNGLIAFGKRNGGYNLKRAYQCHDMKEMLDEVKKVKLPPVKILITGAGRVGKGAMETLAPMNLKKVSPQDFLNKEFNEPVVCQIDADNYAERKDGKPFDFQHFFANPADYKSIFSPYTKVADLYIACHFWDPKSPVFMTLEDMKAKDFKMQVIADVSCDINGPIPSTVRASTIALPFYGYNPHLKVETEPFLKGSVTIMAVDNLPGELPRDASEEFGKALIEKVYPVLFGKEKDTDGVISRATIAKNGKLTSHYSYLKDYIG